jgi:hypothetical protein
VETNKKNSVKVMGEASNKALINLVGSGVLSTNRIVQYRGYQDISQKKISQENKRKMKQITVILRA